MSIESQIRAAVSRCDKSTAKLARLSQVNRQSIQRFLRGGGLSLPNLEAVAQVCGFRLSLEPLETTEGQHDG